MEPRVIAYRAVWPLPRRIGLALMVAGVPSAGLCVVLGVVVSPTRVAAGWTVFVLGVLAIGLLIARALRSGISLNMKQDQLIIVSWRRSIVLDQASSLEVTYDRLTKRFPVLCFRSMGAKLARTNVAPFDQVETLLAEARRRHSSG